MNKIIPIILSVFYYSLSCQNLASSLTACYALDGNALEPINNLNGTLGSAVTPTVNRFSVTNSAYFFNGTSNSYIELPDNPLLKPSNAISFSVWLKPNSNSGRHIIYTKNNQSFNFEAYQLCILLGSPVFRLNKANNSNNDIAVSSTTITPGTWYHVAGSIDNSAVKLYINGVLEGSVTSTFSGFDYEVGKKVYLGDSHETFSYPYLGTMDNLRFYNRTLTATEVNLLYTSDPTCVTPPTPPALASFTCADTVCVNQLFTQQNTSTGPINSYYWSACNTTLSPTTLTTNFSSSSLSNPVFMSINKDGSDYYMFVSNNNPGSLSRIYYGTSLNNTPTVTALGTLGGNLPINGEGIWVEKEGANWYGLVIGGTSGVDRISRLNFGNSLSNTPTATNMGNIGGLSYPHRLQIIRAGGNVYAYTVNRSGNTLTRFDFGNSMANTPTGANLGNIGNMNAPSDFSIINYNGNWHAFVCNDGNATITRLDFGSSLLNIPSGSIVSVSGGSLGGPRAIAVWVECNGIKGLVHNRFTNVEFEMSFLAGPTGPINLTSLGNNASFSFPHGLERYREGDVLNNFILNINSNSISRISSLTCNSVPSSTLQNPAAISFTAPGTYTLNLVCNEGQYNQSSFCKVIYVSPPPSIVAVSSQTAICAGSSASLNSSGAQSYTWQPGNLFGPTILVTPSISTIYTVTANSSVGCTGSSTINIQVNALPTLSVIATPSNICLGTQAVISATGAANYLWQPGNLTGPSVTVSPSSSTTYSITGLTSSGCSNSLTALVIISSNPVINVLANPSVVCDNNSSTLTAVGAVNYTWFPGNLSGQTITVSPNSLTVYTVSGSSGTCTAIGHVTVDIGTIVNIVSSGSLCGNSPVALYTSSTNTFTSFNWTGPGIIGQSTTPTITVNAAGLYSVAVSNSLTGCSGTATFQIIGGINPIILNIVPSSTTTCFPGPPVNLLVSASANFTWFPTAEVTPNTGPLVSVTPSVTSSYSVYGSLGSCTGSAVITISVNATPTMITASNTLNVCEGGSVSLFASGATDYVWLPDNLSGPTITVTPLVTTVYTVTGANGNCVSTKFLPINVLPLPVIITSASNNSICIGGSSTLTASGASTVFWLVSDLPAISYSTIVSPSVNTTYSVVGTSSVGCTKTATITINVINALPISINSSPPQAIICAGESVTLTAIGPSTFTWMPGNQHSSTIVFTPSASLIYSVVGENSLCTSSASVFVIVANCLNTPFGVTNNINDPEEMNGGIFRLRFTITAVNNSNTELRTVSLENNLAKTFQYPITYTIESSPRINSTHSALRENPAFDGRANINLTIPSTSTLLANKRDTLTFTVMLNPNGFAGTLKNSTIGFGTDINNIVLSDSSNNGFIWDPDQDGDPTNNNEISLITLHLIDLFIPDGFSPDGDGINDFFIISGLNARPIKLSVFNRWGNKVYEKDNYDNSWDGSINTGGISFGNGKVPEATYYYILQFLDGKKEIKNGFIVVRR
ncbi:LamG-like jellyroll fold domain-containing protein [Aurantibacillus circumpalustris]|uniref:LamG-like jellyroll fold domain-containing protein n=1 Tax=Aurantibacillus circumpalustris TaxID=3036359 RepID=UPI00295B39A5|nr:LamG-like jellyroll fold domain-containing protein [Aurantibacillus circumpalustris]